MAEKIVSAFVNNYLPHLLSIESKALIYHLVQRLKDFNKKINTVEERQALNRRLEAEIKALKLNNSVSCTIIARIFRERYNLKNESDDLVFLLKLVEPSLGFEFFLRTREEQKKLFHLVNKNLNSPQGLQLSRRAAKIDPNLVEQHFFSNLNSSEEKTIKRILINIFKGKEGIGFDAFYLAFTYFFSIKNCNKLDAMEDEALRKMIAPQLPFDVLYLAIMFCYWKCFGKVKLHYFPVFLDCIHVSVQEYHISVDTLFVEEQLKNHLKSLDELMFVEASEDNFLSSDEEDEPTRKKKKK
ncbi:predicted protein [Naegleria gruberi]|uniref:Predicted protein n=1 Tax=Naegleria gruberi TaxID=5762 RepID=D2VC51_NAEGR|nr:uncharacterized protein NAEGRDRAFT_66449 [Naegleria gruberi]EFC45595.1 predicted protein [Naegleria gruberi]|eukprot:XP_002678339.1 predicted protein [Naegleria gruberi strain NEG-M]